VRVDEYFGWAMESDEETDGVVRITCRSSDGRPLVVEAKRLIKAYGFRIEPNDPLEISSTRVQSVSPDFCDMRGEEMRASDTPVWIIGSGKTAMDRICGRNVVRQARIRSSRSPSTTSV
jgi:hypothetical protein